jgi:hypothetical protein
MPLTLLVLENPWRQDAFDGLSVLPFVEGLASYSSDSIRVLAKPFYRTEELGQWLEDFRRRRRGVGQRVVYIAAHGTPGRVGGLPDGTGAINFENFHSLLRSAGYIDGVHLGCCDFGNRDNAKRILHADRRRARSVPCRWVAGYDRTIDWFYSTLVDLVFWRELLRDPGHDAWTACLRTYKRYPQSRELGFRVFRNGPRGRLEASDEARK